MNQDLETTLPDQSSHDSAKAAPSQGHVHGPNCAHSHHAQAPIVRAEAKVGRNDPCPCGSEQKFKKCHGK